MRIKYHFELTDGTKVGQWEVSSDFFDGLMRLGDRIQVSQKHFQVIGWRPNNAVGQGIDPFDKIVIVFPIGADDWIVGNTLDFPDF